MCNEAARRIALDLMRDDFTALRIPLRFPESLPNLASIDSFRITDTTFIVRLSRSAADKEFSAEGVMRRWSWPGPSGKPVYNYRSDSRDFRNSAAQGRCLIAADAFYEFTAPADPRHKKKDKWSFRKTGEAWFGIAGLWREHPAVGEAFTMLTCPPGPDIAPYHDRQIVIVERRDWAGWLSGETPASDVCVPLPAGSLTVEPVLR
ncbi:SOS response-associated peptidase family protein [Sphingomonas sp. PAMC 26621]|uniref:SOS response-associated peptidase family protein n=1 Tax=Sphingomonas sp. PAMC 26621 TaxID=1112213 RepID=UPI00028A216C|nr:SOS response-associated peptidase family protein [Sphingomonas sp. PAMC 26621]